MKFLIIVLMIIFPIFYFLLGITSYKGGSNIFLNQRNFEILNSYLFYSGSAILITTAKFLKLFNSKLAKNNKSENLYIRKFRRFLELFLIEGLFILLVALFWLLTFKLSVGK
ncbi:hypothetical protein [Neisseria chenwenguii]|uniref:hypothetical protein n=1 Tax=Neisseria chenwenguii TaxID=1853278 RepID=UPI000F50FA21|nr:hypothetical protein [Neisseria chenwenguii]